MNFSVWKFWGCGILPRFDGGCGILPREIHSFNAAGSGISCSQSAILRDVCVFCGFFLRTKKTGDAASCRVLLTPLEAASPVRKSAILRDVCVFCGLFKNKKDGGCGILPREIHSFNAAGSGISCSQSAILRDVCVFCRFFEKSRRHFPAQLFYKTNSAGIGDRNSCSRPEKGSEKRRDMA